jgi:hypothetical protein
MLYSSLGIFVGAVVVVAVLGAQNASNRTLQLVLSEPEWIEYKSSLKRFIPGYPIYYLRQWKKQLNPSKKEKYKWK